MNVQQLNITPANYLDNSVFAIPVTTLIQQMSEDAQIPLEARGLALDFGYVLIGQQVGVKLSVFTWRRRRIVGLYVDDDHWAGLNVKRSGRVVVYLRSKQGGWMLYQAASGIISVQLGLRHLVRRYGRISLQDAVELVMQGAPQ